MQDNCVWWKGENASKKRVLMQVLVAQCIALRTSTREVEVSIPPEEGRKNFWPTITKLQNYKNYKNYKITELQNYKNYKNFRLEILEFQWIAQRTSDPEVAVSNPAEDETKFFLVHKESKIRKLQSGYIEILSTYLYLTKMKNKKLTIVHKLFLLSEIQWIARWTSDPDVAGSNPAEDDTNFFLVHKESEIRKFQSGYIVIPSTYFYLKKMKKINIGSLQ